MTAPLIGPIDIEEYLASGQIEQVIAGGENYDGARPCNFDWVRSLSEQCKEYDVTFCFIETGTVFIKDGRQYTIPSKLTQSKMAFRADVNHVGRKMEFTLRNRQGQVIPTERLYKPYYRSSCRECGSQLICNGCSDCGRCR